MITFTFSGSFIGIHVRLWAPSCPDSWSKESKKMTRGRSSLAQQINFLKCCCSGASSSGMSSRGWPYNRLICWQYDVNRGMMVLLPGVVPMNLRHITTGVLGNHEVTTFREEINKKLIIKYNTFLTNAILFF